MKDETYDMLTAFTAGLLVAMMGFMLQLWLLAATTPAYGIILYVDKIGEFPYEVAMFCGMIGLGTINLLAAFHRLWLYGPRGGMERP